MFHPITILCVVLELSSLLRSLRTKLGLITDAHLWSHCLQLKVCFRIWKDSGWLLLAGRGNDLCFLASLLRTVSSNFMFLPWLPGGPPMCQAVSRAAGALLIPVWSGVQNELDVASILKAVEAAVVLQADGTALQSAVRQLLLLRPKDLDAPACLALQEQLSLMGVHPEEDLMLALADMRGDVTLYSY
ncbi:unnamed protein product [Durusdinium trenchii]|uniref:Uncharacterized protein n=1 Tax=Durusdinium trenchii TaxID=1381693 RepID=A0ABP0KLA6_9DINO